jgi:hypothetical protein
VLNLRTSMTLTGFRRHACVELREESRSCEPSY